MALTTSPNVKGIMSPDDFLDFVESNVDLNNEHSILKAAPQLRMVANDRRFILERFNSEIENYQNKNPTPYSQASFLIASREHFYLRGNIWGVPSLQEGIREIEDQMFSYGSAHDHNFTFMTTNYLGPGYETDIYEYNYDEISGSVREKVKLKFLERTSLFGNKVMVYRKGRDVHIQHPPSALSVSLNLMIYQPSDRVRDQFYFNLNEARIDDRYPEHCLSSKRSAVIKFCKTFNSEETVSLLETIFVSHPCKRTRVAAADVLVQIRPDLAKKLLLNSVNDSESLVRNYAQSQLTILASGS